MGRPHLPGLGLLVPAIRLPADYARVDHFRKLAADGVAGFLLFGGDDELVPPFLRSLREAAGRPLLVMTDAERGVGQQVAGCAELPPLMAVGATLSEERAYHHGRVTALEARALGVNMVLAPVVDVLSRPTNPILGNRSFGSGPDLVAKLGAAWIAGAQEQGVLACAKHFPGHGDTSGDSHAVLPTVAATRAEMDVRELPAFRAAIGAGVGAVMTAHVRYPALDPEHPATVSRRILGNLLRDELGFGGLVLSDALTMEGLLLAGRAGRLSEEEAAVRCVEAGCDLLLHPTDPYAVAAAVEAANAQGRVEVSSVLARILLTLSDLPGAAEVASELRAEHLYGAYALARDSLTVLANRDRVLPLLPARRGRILAVLLDDDDDARRESPFREHAADFRCGFLRVTPEAAERCTAGEFLAAVDDADVVLLAVAASIRASKGRAEMAPPLRALASSILQRADRRAIVVLFSAPGALSGVEPAPGTLVAAWGDAPVTLRAALDAILSGGPLRGLDPTVGAS